MYTLDTSGVVTSSLMNLVYSNPGSGLILQNKPIASIPDNRYAVLNDTRSITLFGRLLLLLLKLEGQQSLCIIELFGWVLHCHMACYNFSVDVGAFAISLSQTSSLSSWILSEDLFH